MYRVHGKRRARTHSICAPQYCNACAREEQKRRARRKENSLPLTHSFLQERANSKTQKRWRRTPRERLRLKMRKKRIWMEKGDFCSARRPTFFSLTQWERNKCTVRVNRKSICMSCVAVFKSVRLKSMPDEQVA